MGKYFENTEIRDEIENGQVLRRTVTTNTSEIKRSEEPDFIKLYTKLWMEYNDIPLKYRNLFILLATNMSPCDSQDLEHSQLVTVSGTYKDKYMKAMGWTNESSLKHGLKALCDCGAIARASRGIYRINPSYAAKGSWLSVKDPDKRSDYSGIRDFILKFDLIKQTMTTSVVTDLDDGFTDNLTENKALFSSDGERLY